MLGLLIGTLGLAAIGLPGAAQGVGAPVGVVLVLVAVALYGVAFDIAGRLQREHGALPVIWRAMLIATLLLAPAGPPDLMNAQPVPHAILALVLLGGESAHGFALAGGQ